MKSVWSVHAVSEYPLNQPMVGQEKFYNYFSNFVETLGSSRMARIFPLIADWGIGKSRIGFELVSEVLGKDKGWVIRGDNNSAREVRILEDNFDDNILPIYISYSDMNHEDLAWDEWVAFGTYVALKGLAGFEGGTNKSKSFRERIASDLVDHLQPFGFSSNKLKSILKLDTYSEEDLLDIENQGLLDDIISEAHVYFANLGIKHFMIIADEVESKTEVIKDKASDEELKKKLDGDAIQLISHAIKHEDVRTKHPYVSYLLLCSPAIGDQFRGLGALDRRMDMCEIKRNSFADISYFLQELTSKDLVPEYPEGLVEAAYTIAGGNFGWFNVIMAHVDQYLQNNGNANTAEIFKYCLNSVSRFDKLLDKSSLEVINVNEQYRPLVEEHLLLQLPKSLTDISDSELRALQSAKTELGDLVFKRFKLVELNKPEIANYLVQQGDYEPLEEGIYSNVYGGEFDLDLMLKSIKTFSLNTEKNEYLVGSDKETFINQIRMLYPEDEAERAAELLYDLLQEKIDDNASEYIGPSFSFLSRFNKQYSSNTGQSGYLVDNVENERLEKQLQEIKNDRENHIDRILTGFSRIIKQNYPSVKDLDIDLPAKRIEFLERPISLLVHPANIVDVIWGQDTDKLKEGLQKKVIAQEGVHPIFVLSSTSAIRDDIVKLQEDFDRVGRGIIFMSLNKVQISDLEVFGVKKEYIDISNSRSFTRSFRERINRIKDEINDKSKGWFEKIDRDGWILRPIKPDRKNNDEIIRDITKVYKKMLIENKTLLEVEAQNNELDKDLVERVRNILPKLSVPSRLATKGYKTIGIFKEENGDYTAHIPKSFPRLLSYLGESRKADGDIEKDFYFSLQEAVSSGNSVSKIIKQVKLFLQELGVIEREDHFNRVTENALKLKYLSVKEWLDDSYDKIINQLASVINDNFINQFRTTKKANYERRLHDAKKILDGLKIDKLQKLSTNNNKNWQSIIIKLDDFYETCKYIYDKEKWNNLSFNENEIETLKPLEDNTLIWRRIRLIQLFHEHVNKLKKPAAEKIEAKVNDISDDSKYKGFNIPISPITLMLKEYKKELDYSTDATMTQSAVIVDHYTDTLAFKLQDAQYKDALERLRRILNECGLTWTAADGIDWTESGLIERYKRSKNNLQKIIDGYLDNEVRVEKWNTFFSNASEEWKSNHEYKRMNQLYSTLKLFLEGGLQQTLDDEEADTGVKNLLEVMESEVNNKLQFVGQLKGSIDSVENFVKERYYYLYDHRLIKAVNKIKAKQGEGPYTYHPSDLPEEETYKEAKEKVENLMNEFRVDGNQYFDNMQTTFDFFINVVNDIDNIDWNSHQNEERELMNKGFIKIKREVI
ncbi:MAG: hypothetical protein ACOCRO_00660 [Halanaerobiales bacterium]